MGAYFEDIVIGETTEIGSHSFTADEIVSFAERFDPQRFHMDHRAAEESLFGGLCASGWHTAAVWMRLMVRHRQRVSAEVAAAGGSPARLGGSPGFRELKWIKPVFVGDVISYRSVAEEKIELRSRPEWGLLVTRNEGVNQHGDVVFSFVGQVFVERRGAQVREPG